MGEKKKKSAPRNTAPWRPLWPASCVGGGERVHQRVDELHGTGAEDDVLVVGDGVPDGPVQQPDVALQLHGLVLAVVRVVAQAVPPGDHHRAVSRVAHPVRLQEHLDRAAAATKRTYELRGF
jgi:hypothetical protein